MTNLAMHLRIANLVITDDDVDKRKKGIADLAAAYGKIKGMDSILGKAGDIATALGGDGVPPSSLNVEVQSAIGQYASSFLSSERPLEVGICSAVAALEVVSTQTDPNQTEIWTMPDIFAASLWSALSFQAPLADPKRESLRSELRTAAHGRSIRTAEIARKRREVPDFREFALVAESLSEVPSTFKKATSDTINALRHNASLDREELDFLWLAMLGRSRLLNKQLTKLKEPLRLVASGIEAAAYLCNLPCDVHRELVLRSASADDELNLVDLLKEIANNREPLIAKLTTSVFTQTRTVFPLLSTLVLNNADIDGSSVKRPTSDWGARALLEASLYHLRQSLGSL